MSKHHDDQRIELEGLPTEEGVSTGDAAEQLAQEPEEKRNFTETHPAEARRAQQVMREGGRTD
jgi:hypothetical protein